MEKERVKMSEMERKVFLANVELVNKQKEYRRDISKLISYIKGNKQLEEEVNSIISYYTRVTPGGRNE